MDNRNERFLELFELQRKKLSAYAMALTRNREDAKDLVSDTLLRALENFDKIKSDQTFPSYIFAVASNLHKRRNWRKRIWGVFSSEQAEEIPGNSQSAEISLDVEALYAALDKLPAAQKEAVILFEISGFSIKEIAEIQGSTESGVKSRLKRGREALAKLMNDHISPDKPVNIIKIDTKIAENEKIKANLEDMQLRMIHEKV